MSRDHRGRDRQVHPDAYDGDVDVQCVNLAIAIDQIPGLRTISSCCGHGDGLFRIGFLVDDERFLPILLYFIDKCHVNLERSWICRVTTDCAMSPITHCIESPCKGKKAYVEAEMIALELQDYFKSDRYPEKLKEIEARYQCPSQF